MDVSRWAAHLEIFVEVARLGSFSAAARRRGVAASSVVRRIDALEAELETRLFLRSTRELTPTDAGTRLLVRAEEIIDRLAATRSEIGALEETPTGLLRVSCLPAFARHHVLPIVGKLIDAWPALNIELRLTERLADPAKDRCDAAIRIGVQPDGGSIATRIGDQRWIVCAAPRHLTEHGRPLEVADLATHRRIGKASEPPGLGWNRFVGSGIDFTDRSRVFRCDDFESQRIAALDGIGVAVLPNWLVDRDIASGRLVQLFDKTDGEEMPILILRAERNAPPKLRVFIDALRASFAKDRAGGR